MDGDERQGSRPGSPRPSWNDRLRRDAALREAGALRRRVRQMQQRDGVHVHVDGRRLLNFASNDYLGLAQHLDLTSALQEAAAWTGVGSTASHLVCGHHRDHVRLEELAAEWQKYPRALLFGSGYLANLGVLQALLREGDLCVQDKLNHACLIDGARHSGAELKRYPHADADAALRQLRARPDAAALLATDGVFSMDGDIAPLRSLAVAARSEDALFYVDDAHGVGVLGAYGRGSVAQAGLGVGEVPLQMITLGKALGGYGALVLGREDLIEAIEQRARPYLFTTAMPPALAAASCAAIELVRRDSSRRMRLGALVARFRRGAAQLGLNLMDSHSAIQPVLLGHNQAALDAAAALEAAGFLVPAIRPPTVAAGTARLRVSLSAAHEDAHVDRLLDALATACKAATALPGTEAAVVVAQAHGVAGDANSRAAAAARVPRRVAKAGSSASAPVSNASASASPAASAPVRMPARAAVVAARAAAIAATAAAAVPAPSGAPVENTSTSHAQPRSATTFQASAPSAAPVPAATAPAAGTHAEASPRMARIVADGQVIAADTPSPKDGEGKERWVDWI